MICRQTKPEGVLLARLGTGTWFLFMTYVGRPALLSHKPSVCVNRSLLYMLLFVFAQLEHALIWYVCDLFLGVKAARCPSALSCDASLIVLQNLLYSICALTWHGYRRSI